MTREIYVGRIRSVTTHTLISLVTGIYFFVWFTQINHELRKNRAGAGPHPAVLLIVFIVLPVIGWFITPFLSGAHLRKVQTATDADKRSSSWIPALWGLVPIIGWSISAAYLQSGSNRAWEILHRKLGKALEAPTLLECPDCSNRFEQFVNPLEPTRVVCRHCGRGATL